MPFVSCVDSMGFPTKVEYFNPEPERPFSDFVSLSSSIQEGGADGILFEFSFNYWCSPITLLKQIQAIFGYPNVLVRTLDESGKKDLASNGQHSPSFGIYFEVHKEFFCLPPSLFETTVVDSFSRGSVKADRWAAADEIDGIPFLFYGTTKSKGINAIAKEQVQRVRRFVTKEPELAGVIRFSGGCATFRISLAMEHVSLVVDLISSFQPWHYYNLSNIVLFSSRKTKLTAVLSRKVVEGFRGLAKELSILIELDQFDAAFLERAGDRFGLNMKGRLTTLLKQSYITDIEIEATSAIFFREHCDGDEKVSFRWCIREGKPRQFQLSLSSFSDQVLENCFGWILKQLAIQGGKVGIAGSVRSAFAGMYGIHDNLPALNESGAIIIELASHF